VVAVHVLTHEAMHLSGRLDEAVAECAAVQRDAQTVRLLGARPTDTAALAAMYWENIYPLMPDRYRSGECRPGGPWTSAWPTRRARSSAARSRGWRDRQDAHAGRCVPEHERPVVVAGVDRLGLAGAILGYLIFTVGLGIGDTDIFDFGGIISAIIGTVIVLFVVGFFVRRRDASRV
jgi:hypothetical protein